jgi:hypothetical protein
MLQIIGLYLLFLAGIISAVILVQGVRQTADLLSLRNFFLLGFMLFQLTGGVYTLWTGNYGEFPPSRAGLAALIYAVLVTIFLLIFWGVYSSGWISRWLSLRIPVGHAAPGPTSMLTLSVAFLGVGIVFRNVLVFVPIFGPLSDIIGASLLAAACGMAAWAWAPRLSNPLFAGPALAIMFVAFLALLAHSFGRRDILGITAAVAWGIYHGYWKYLGPRSTITRLALLGIAGVLLLVMFTAARSGSERQRTISQTVQAMKQSSMSEGMHDLLTGQLAAANSMWIIDTRPEPYPYDTLHTLVYLVTQPIPRVFWQNKPDSLGRIAPAQARIRKRPKNWSIGPGMIGHIYNDNPWIAMVLYAGFLALFLGLLDRLVLLYPANPFVVLPAGVSLGQIIGLSRGELGLFLFRGIAYIIITWIGMFLIAKAMASMGWVMRTTEEEEVLHDDTWEDYASDGTPEEPVHSP